jgi:hypothetical protein
MSSLALAEHQHSSWHWHGAQYNAPCSQVAQHCSCVQLHWGHGLRVHCRSDCQCAACGPPGGGSEDLRPAALPSVIAGSESSSRFLFSPQPSGLPVKLGGSLPVPSAVPSRRPLHQLSLQRPWPLAQLELHRSSRPLTISGTVTNVLFCSCRPSPLNSLSVCTPRGYL